MSPGDWGEIATAVVAAIAAIVGLFTYRADVLNKRADLLYRFFEDFYRSDTYKLIRRALDNPESSHAGALRHDVVTQADSELHEAFVDYLNFFEFQCNLVELNRIQRTDMVRMFDYYLTNLARRDWVQNYAEQEGFEALSRELRRRMVPRK
jgi:hypothetical protein